jgi:methylenetetrahydrofolate dehydrogenase (NADP+)/methenyltetrahydrofolate cyclohydrolase
MTAVDLNGKKLAEEIRGEIAKQVEEFRTATNIQPCLATVLVGDDPASTVYIRNKKKACEAVGMRGIHHGLSASAKQSELLDVIERLNEDPLVHGILVQLPLPKQIKEQSILDAVDPQKDVDCFHPYNVGLLAQGRPRFLPCTPFGVQQILHRNNIPVAGRHVVIVGRSEIVGKPLALLMMQRSSVLGATAANATVTVCHSRTNNLSEITRTADILVAAIGQANFIGSEMVRPGAIVIDVGINRTEAGLAGDVDYHAVREIASYITPVPGGIGPLTVTMLLANTLIAARLAVEPRQV